MIGQVRIRRLGRTSNAAQCTNVIKPKGLGDGVWGYIAAVLLSTLASTMFVLTIAPFSEMGFVDTFHRYYYSNRVGVFSYIQELDCVKQLPCNGENVPVSVSF
jgi:hypothetical protein